MKEIKCKELSMEVFQMYGSYANMINPDEDGAYKFGAEPIEFFRDIIQTGLGQTNFASFSTCKIKQREILVNVAEYHNYCYETVLPLDGDVVIFVAPAVGGDDFPSDEAEAFKIPRGTLVTLRPGVWHHAPYTLDNENVSCVIILPERAYKNDLFVVEIPAEEQVKIKI